MALKPPRGRQRDVLAMRPEGHIVVLGTAGSGKTTVAALRAQILSDRLHPNYGRTLLVTYNKSLVTYLKNIAAEELANVTVETFHKFALGYLAGLGRMNRSIVSTNERLSLIRAALAATDINLAISEDWTQSNLIKRFDRQFSVISRSILTRSDYVVDEIHCDEELVKLYERNAIYDAFERYSALKNINGERFDFDDVIAAALQAMTNDARDRRYKHIVIDEGQDFSPSMLRLLIASVPPDGSVTFFGDVAQQIYGRETNWREAGFRIEEPIIFEQNFRNTPEIIRLGLAISRMPYYHNVPDLVAPVSDSDEGPPPTLVRYSSPEAELDGICQQARDAVRTQNVAIICPSKSLIGVISARLRKFKLSNVLILDRNLPIWYAEETPHIYVANYHNAKGLEFGAVILAFCSELEMPAEWLQAAFGEDEARRLVGSQFYVGVTRCRRNLIMTYSGSVTRLLPANETPPLYQIVNL